MPDNPVVPKADSGDMTFTIPQANIRFVPAGAQTRSRTFVTEGEGRADIYWADGDALATFYDDAAHLVNAREMAYAFGAFLDAFQDGMLGFRDEPNA